MIPIAFCFAVYADPKLPSNIYLKAKKAGGMKITFQSPPKNLDEKMLYNILRDYKMLNCEVLVRDENGRILQIVHHRLADTE